MKLLEILQQNFYTWQWNTDKNDIKSVLQVELNIFLVASVSFIQLSARKQAYTHAHYKKWA